MLEPGKTLFQCVNWELVAGCEGSDIKVDSLCEIGSPLLQFFDVFGFAFKPVSNDIAGNLQKIENAKKVKPELRQTLSEMLQHEIELQTANTDPSGCIGLLWFKRGLEYMCAFLALLYDSRDADTELSTSVISQKAYDMTLKNYHGWFMKKTFSVVSSAAPYRNKLIEKLRNGSEISDQEFYELIGKFVINARQFMHQLNTVLLSFSLEVQPLAELGPVPTIDDAACQA